MPCRMRCRSATGGTSGRTSATRPAEVRSHSACGATVNPPRPAGVREQSTRERWRQIHNLLNKGVGLLECARRLNLSLNTVKCYARTREPEALRRAPRYRPTLVDPYRDHLRKRRATDPAVPVQQLFREIKEFGYTGSLNLLYRYITQGRAEGERPVTTPRHLARLLLEVVEPPILQRCVARVAPGRADDASLYRVDQDHSIPVPGSGHPDSVGPPADDDQAQP